jgi:hypothetical protein
MGHSPRRPDRAKHAPGAGIPATIRPRQTVQSEKRAWMCQIALAKAHYQDRERSCEKRPILFLFIRRQQRVSAFLATAFLLNTIRAKRSSRKAKALFFRLSGSKSAC